MHRLTLCTALSEKRPIPATAAAAAAGAAYVCVCVMCDGGTT